MKDSNIVECVQCKISCNVYELVHIKGTKIILEITEVGQDIS